jgi:Short repeat of unknown function (DUF308)
MKTLLFILVSFTAVTALICGLIMISNPDGKAMGLALSVISETPFKDFLIPGIFLTSVGVINFIAAFFNIQRNKNRYTWALAGGIILCGWIAVQLILIHQISWLQFVYLGVGLLTILTAYQLKGKWAV